MSRMGGGQEQVAYTPDTFMTSLQGSALNPNGSQVVVHEPEAMGRVREEYLKLKTVVGNLNSKVSDVLAKQERDFLAAYRAHMYSVQKELQDLRAKVAEAATSLQKNDKIHKLEEERDWYRKEALRLDGFTTAMKKELKYMRDKLESIEEDRNWLERQLKASKKQNKLLRAELEIRLSATHAQADSNTKFVAVFGNDEDTSNINGEGMFPDPNRHTKSGADLMEYGRGVSDFERIQTKPRPASGGPTRQRGMGGLSRTLPTKGIMQQEQRKQKSHHKQDISDAAAMRKQMKQLRAQLASEKKNARQLRAQILNDQTQKAALEELFLRCVESVQRDIARRKKRTALNNSPSLKQRAKTPTGGRASDAVEGAGSGPESQGDLADSMEVDKAALSAVAPSDFTAADRVHVIERLLGQDEVLSFLYDHLFPPPEESTNPSTGTPQPGKWQGAQQQPVPSSSPMNAPGHQPHAKISDTVDLPTSDGFRDNSFEGPPAVAGSGVNAVMGLAPKSPGGIDSSLSGGKLNLDLSTQQYLLQHRK